LSAWYAAFSASLITLRVDCFSSTLNRASFRIKFAMTLKSGILAVHMC
jgi:hypothetical protein